MLSLLASASRPAAAGGGACSLALGRMPCASWVRCCHDSTSGCSGNSRPRVFFDKKAVDVGTALVGKASRGDVLKLQLKIQDGVIRDVKFRALGDSSIASRLLAERITGRSLEDAECLIGTGCPAQFDAKTYGAVLAKQAIGEAIANYKEKHASVRDHFSNPRNVGTLDRRASDVGAALIGKASQGGVIRMHVRVRDGVVVEAMFKAVGCSSVVASCSCATEMIIGQRLSAAEKLADKTIASHLRLPPGKAHCSRLAAEAVQAAVAHLRAKHAIVRNGSIGPRRNAGATSAITIGVNPFLQGRMQQGKAERDTAGPQQRAA